MPELPEVETTVSGIRPHIQQQTIAKVVVRKPKLRWPIPNLAALLQGQTILAVERRAKYILITTEEGTLIIHLGMSGNLRILPAETPPKKHDHVDIVFKNNKLMRFNDPRRFGAMLWAEGDPLEHVLLKTLGVEPLSTAFNGDYLLQRARRKQLAVKAFLMDSKVVVGVGNIYAAEALFAAGIHPLTPASAISSEAYAELAKAIKQILKQAIKRGGTTLKDFLNSDGEPGYFSMRLKVYGRAGEPCSQCQTTLQTMQIAQRSTVYCTTCQPPYRRLKK